MGENSYLQILSTPFPTQSAVTLERLGVAFQNFVDIFCSYSRAKKKESRRMGENSYLQILSTPFPTQSAVTSEQLGAAFWNFVDVFCSYSRAK